MWTLFLIQTNDTTAETHLWQSSNWISFYLSFYLSFSTSLCHQLTLQSRMPSSGTLDLSFPPPCLYNYITHLQNPHAHHSKEKWWIVCSWVLFEKSKPYIFIRAFRDCRRKQLSPWSLFLAAPQRLPSENSSTQLPWKERERVKFEPWIASLSSLCIICQSWIKGVFCPPAASPGVHISLDLATFLRSTSREINAFTFLWKVAFLYPPTPYFYLIFIFNQILQTRQIIWEGIFKFLLSNFLRIASWILNTEGILSPSLWRQISAVSRITAAC